MRSDRTSRSAWGLVAILALLTLGGGGVLGVSYLSRLPREQQALTLLSQDKWGFGEEQQVTLWSRGNLYGVTITAERWKMGFFAVPVKGPRHPPVPGPPPSAVGYWSSPRRRSALIRYVR